MNPNTLIRFVRVAGSRLGSIITHESFQLTDSELLARRSKPPPRETLQALHHGRRALGIFGL
jgi:hypothetical protein